MPRIFYYVLAVLFSLPIFGNGSAWAGSEFVTVAKILANDDHAIVVRAGGDAYQIEKGVGCISFYRYEGRQVLISSPGIFLGIGSELILPNDNQKCRIWDSKEIGQWVDAPSTRTNPSKRPQKSASGNCIDGHWISSVSSNGEILILEDRSVWEVDLVDAIHTMLWLPVQKVLVCDGRIINISDGKSVRALRLK